MDQNNNVFVVFAATQFDRGSLIARNAISWLIRKVYTFLYVLSYPVVRILFSFVAIILLTNVMYVALKVMFLPVGFIHEDIHFDYLCADGPTANLTLVSVDQQWQYMSVEQEHRGAERGCDQPFFGPHTDYDISLSFSLARSLRNRDAGACMARLQVLDCRGAVLAVSSRSVRLPYESSAVQGLWLLLRLPLLLPGLASEHHTVSLPMMRGYKEHAALPPAHSFQVSLSQAGASMDIERTQLLVEPRPSGIAYLFYSFPFTSFFALNIFLVSFFFFSSACMFVMGYAFQGRSAFNRVGDEAEDEAEADDEDEGSEGSSDEGSGSADESSAVDQEGRGPGRDQDGSNIDTAQFVTPQLSQTSLRRRVLPGGLLPAE